MDQFDTLVMDHLQDRLFQPDRLNALLGSVMALRSERASEVDIRITRLQTKTSNSNERLQCPDQMVENGVTEFDEILKERVGALKPDRDKAALNRICEARSSVTTFDPETIKRPGRLTQDNAANGAIPFRKPTCM